METDVALLVARIRVPKVPFAFIVHAKIKIKMSLPTFNSEK